MANPESQINPFTLLSLDYRRFYGSKGILIPALHAIAYNFPGVIEVVGLQGMGKTSMLRHLANLNSLLSEEDSKERYKDYLYYMQTLYHTAPHRLFPVMVEFSTRPHGCSPACFIFQRLEAAYTKFRREFSDLGELPDIPAAGENMIDEVVNFLHNLALIDIRPYFLFDDYDMVLPPEDRPFDPEQMLELSEVEGIARFWRRDAAFILTTQRRLREINKVGSSYWGSVTTKLMEGLAESEAMHLVKDTMGQVPEQPTALLEGEARPYSQLPEQDVKTVLRLAGNFPYLVIRAASILWEMRYRGNLLSANTPLDNEEVEILSRRLRETFNRFYQSYWDAMNTPEKTGIQRLAQGNLQVSKAVLYSILDKGLITAQTEPGTERSETGQRYQVFSALFEQFVLEQPPVTRENPPVAFLRPKERKMYDLLYSRFGETCSLAEIDLAVNSGAPGQAPAKDDEPGKDQERDKEKEHRLHMLTHRLNKRLKEKDNPFIVSSDHGKGYRLVEKPK